MQQGVTRPWIAGAVALVSASAVAAAPVVNPVAAPLAIPSAAEILLAAQDITLDLVRHGESVDNAEDVLGTIPPGAALTALGQQQATDVAPGIQAAFPDGIEGIYASEFLRAQDTAQPLADLLNMDITTLPGLNELHGGFLEGQSLDVFAQIGYIFAPVMWIMGQYWMPQLGSTIDVNGVVFNDRVSDAIEAIYSNTISDPDSPMTSVAFAHAGTIAIWTLMNVKNPDLWLVINEGIKTLSPLANAAQVVIEGNPTDGWTLVSWDGHEVSATPDLLTGLFVDWRDLTTAPQIATWHILEAIQGGDQAEIAAALETGFDQVVAAISAFPQAVIDTFTDAFGA
ncbi:histidine phosphatase family protein [Mycobacterium sp. pW045]|uniref:histidine phosphatase family protein n=1 Tax=Mycobacterium sp. pW045 TaxID=3238984 RepID=UPI00351B37CF